MVGVKLTVKQTEALDILENNSNSIEEVIFGGGAGGAKSFLGCYWILKMAWKYEGTRYLIGRSKLKALKQSTLITLFEVMKMMGITSELYNYNQTENTIRFSNDSVIILKDLFTYPSDPEFDSLGSLEITAAYIDEVAQIDKKAWDIVKSRIRYKLNEFNLIPKILGTLNPSKNWCYTFFYKPFKEGTLSPNKTFIQSLVYDNPYISKHYINSLKQLPLNQRQRLLEGLWEVQDTSQLITDDALWNIYDNVHVEEGTKYITADIAAQGSDSAVIVIWNNLIIEEIIISKKLGLDVLSERINSLAQMYKINKSNIIVDADGIGLGVAQIYNFKEFKNGSKALKDENYQNLKTQCYYKLAEYINDNKIWIRANLSEEVRLTLREELEQIQSEDTKDTDKLRIINKDQVKNNIGRSPDISDAIMMRMFFEYKDASPLMMYRPVSRV